VTQIVAPTVPLPGGERIVGLRVHDVLANKKERRIGHDIAIWRDELRSVEDIGAFRSASRNLVVGGVRIPRSRTRSTSPARRGLWGRKGRIRFGREKTRWRTGNGGGTWSARWAATFTLRRTLQEGQMPAPIAGEGDEALGGARVASPRRPALLDDGVRVPNAERGRSGSLRRMRPVFESTRAHFVSCGHIVT
jgi:hypothetical protein